MTTWSKTLRFTGALIAATVTMVQSAEAQGIERSLAGIRLNSSSKTVLLKFGNPDEVVVGNVGVRVPPSGGRVGGVPGATGGFAGAGGYPGGSGYGPGAAGIGGGGPSGIDGGPGASAFAGGAGKGDGGGLPGLGAPGAGGGAFGPGGPGADIEGGGFPGAAGGYPGPGGFGGAGGAGGFAPGVGRTVSTLAQQQEVTWIYNRSTKNKNGETQIVSYEFLIGPNGNVSQIRMIGYTGGNSLTQKGIGLGNTYQQMVRVYGFPENHVNYGPNLLIASYRKANHVQFQLLADRNPNTNALRGYKVIGITIATVE